MSYDDPLTTLPADPDDSNPGNRGDFTRRKLAHFRLMGELGSGAFGTVYRALDTKLQREVALKIPSERLMSSQVAQERFLREARAAAQLNHPNICPIYEVGQVNGRPFYSMALVRGGSLRSFLQKKRPLPERTVGLLVRKLALALATAHRAGIVHRDLKPENILIDESGQPIIADFGLAKNVKRQEAALTERGAVVGTPAYMAPEQLRGQDATAASDIFSLGAIFYELLCGRRPFEGNGTELLQRIARSDTSAPSPTIFRSDLSPGIVELCLRCLEKDVSRRIASMDELAGQLRTLLLATNTNASTLTVSGQASDPKFDALIASLEDTQSTLRRRSLSTPVWLSSLAVATLVILLGVFTLLRSEYGNVRFQVNIDVTDPALSVLLDGNPIAPHKLKEDLELPLGEHELVIYRGGVEIQRIAFKVSSGTNMVPEQIGRAPSRETPSDAALVARLLESGAQLVVLDEKGEPVALPSPNQRALNHVSLVQVHFPADVTPTDKTIAWLKESRRLAQLHVADASLLSAASLESLAELEHLSQLHLASFPSQLAPLKSFKSLSLLTRLELPSTEIHDVDMEALQRCMAVEQLNLSHVNFEPGTFSHVGRLPNLRSLRLDGITVDAAECGDFPSQDRLETLSLRNSRLALEWFTSDFAPALRFVDASSTLTTNQARPWIENHPQLIELDLSGTEISGDFFASAPPILSLERVGLRDTVITDVDLPFLTQLPRLSWIDLSGTFVTESGTAQFKAQRSSCQVVWHPDRFRDLGAKVAEAIRTAGGEVTFSGDDLAPAKMDSFDTDAATQLVTVKAKGSRDQLLSLLPLLSRTTSVTALDLRDDPIVDDDLVHLRYLDRLEFLELAGTSISDLGLVHLRDLRSLHTLDLSRTQVGGVGLQKLVDLPLRTLTLGVSRDSPLQLGALADLNRLRHLDLTDIPLQSLLNALPAPLSALESLTAKRSTGNDLERLQDWKSLVSLDLSGSDLHDEDLEHLARLPNLASLRLRDTAIAGETLSKLHRLPLRSLSLSATPLTGPGVLHLAGFSGLEEIELQRTPVDNASLAALSKIASLKRIDVTDAWTTPAIRSKFRQVRPDCLLLPEVDLDQTPSDRTLIELVLSKQGTVQAIQSDGRTLAINCNNLAESDLIELGRVKSLRQLTIRQCRLSDSCKRRIAGLAFINRLTLEDINMEAADFRALANMRSLRSLGLGQLSIDMESAQSLASIPQLNLLSLHRCSLSPEVKMYLERSFQGRTLRISP